MQPRHWACRALCLAVLVVAPGCSEPVVAELTFSADESGLLRLDRENYRDILFQNLRNCTKLDLTITPNGRQHAMCYRNSVLVADWTATPSNGAPFSCWATGDETVKCITQNLLVIDTLRTPGLFNQPETYQEQICDPIEFMPCEAVDDPNEYYPDDVGLNPDGLCNYSDPDDPDCDCSDPADPNCTPVGNPPDGVCDYSDPDDPDCEPCTPGEPGCPPTGGCAPGDPDCEQCDLTRIQQLMLDSFQQFVNEQGIGQYVDVHALNIPIVEAGPQTPSSTQNFCNPYLTACMADPLNPDGGGCFCHDLSNSLGDGIQCNCNPLTAKGRKIGCQFIEVDCVNLRDQIATLRRIEVDVMMHLYSQTWTYQPPGAHPKGLCSGTPLVLDLAGDGIKPTSLAEGVDFDLAGIGPLRTAWVTGDDALLVLDRNGNGRIDDGTELFGGITPAGERQATDGFLALAALDTPALGGNQDGRVDRNDLLFGELRLWQDADKNGKSTPAELRTLGDAEVQAIDVTPHGSYGRLDSHGNDLGMRGSFIRTDGSTGTVIDVLFTTGR